MEALKPCPKCKSANIIESETMGDTSGGGSHIEYIATVCCEDCGYESSFPDWHEAVEKKPSSQCRLSLLEALRRAAAELMEDIDLYEGEDNPRILALRNALENMG